MYCIKCGNELAPDAVFCSKCGASQNGGMNANAGLPSNSANFNGTMHDDSERLRLIEAADNSLKVMDMIAKKQIKLNEDKAKFDKSNKKYRNNIVIALIFFFGILCAVPESLSAVQKKTLTGAEGTIISLILCGIGALLIFYAVRVSKKKTKLNKENDENNKVINQEIYELQCDKSLDWLPVNYREPIPFDCIYRYLLDKRANNLQEALNLFETELHQARMEQIAVQNSYR